MRILNEEPSSYAAQYVILDNGNRVAPETSMLMGASILIQRSDSCGTGKSLVGRISWVP